ncbi:uncharacterized protein LOC111371175 [Olea europaea var. sylvestris]|uniref:uncharacterized protein LOC111371175 n=1 Tax=Olea europaea var. sylvestris TaxID=158386 RepID=UPI000C1D2906|nr:uncharacterized protein LOC111371175 [Olea europaea var. sylvestris]
MAILETKLEERKLMRILRNKFIGFWHANNFATHKGGRILILWNPSKVILDVMEVHPQIIHCKAICKVTSFTFLVSFVYGFHTMVCRRPLWENIMDFNTNVALPWMILGDFNNVLKFDEKSNGADVNPYEIKDLANCCLQVGLTDVRSIGCFLTWTNGSVWSKIDRAMINDIWVQNGPHIGANFLPSGYLSDHSLCIVSVDDCVGSGKKPFKFFNIWTMHEDFLDIVQSSWRVNVRGTKQFVLCKKLRKLKVALKELNSKHFGRISTRANEAKSELEAAQIQLENQPRNLEFQVLVKSLRKKSLELVYCPFRPIQREIITNDPLVSLEQGNSLIREITYDEVKEALFDIGDDKSPGPDGYTSCFFKNAWGIICDEFVGAILEFFSLGSMLKQLNHSVIALVPKSDHALHVGDFRPISCCNVIYKVTTKILASRLRLILGDIVDQAQAAFIEGRSMTKNIHLAQELMRQYNRKRVAPRCLLKIDISKAFDSVSWDFLKSVLEGLNFPLRFVQWIMECVTTPTYSVALNGSMHGFFKGGKGLRQGDPLSPFLFVICLEYFSRMIKDATNDSDFNYHPKCGPLKITHLTFADDLMLFARGDAMSVEILCNCLYKFGLASSLKIKTTKSSIYTAGIFGYELQNIMEVSKFSKGSMPFRYLGIPLASEKLKVSSYAPFLEKIAGYIGAWSCASLSYAGKMELIRAPLSELPLGIKEAIGCMEESMPSESGRGPWLKDLKTWNLALLAKSIWNIQNKKDTLWIRWVNQVYLKGTCIWEVSPKKDHSPLFKKLLEIRDVLAQSGAAGHHQQVPTVGRNNGGISLPYSDDFEHNLLGNVPQHLGRNLQILGSFVHRQTASVSRQFSDFLNENLGCLGMDKFRTKFAYDFFRPKGSFKTWGAEIWKPCITPKHSFLLWLGVQSKLLTKDKLHFLDIDMNCVFCAHSEETCEHLFFKCSFTSSLWGNVRR